MPSNDDLAKAIMDISQKSREILEETEDAVAEVIRLAIKEDCRFRYDQWLRMHELLERVEKRQLPPSGKLDK